MYEKLNSHGHIRGRFIVFPNVRNQLTAYLVAEAEATLAALCVLVKRKEPAVEWYVTSRSAAQIAEYLTKAQLVAREITSGHFYKRPGKWCAWCDYLPICMGTFGRPTRRW